MITIDPKTVYWFSALSSLKMISSIVAIGAGVSFFILFMIFTLLFDDMDKEIRRGFWRGVITIGIVFIFSICGAVFAPDKETMYTMLLSGAMPENSGLWTPQLVKETADYLVKAFNTLK